MGKAKAQGTRWETALVTAARAFGIEGRRLAEGGINDPGDIQLEPSNGDIWIIEAKHRANLNAHQALSAAKKKAPAYALVAVAWKKTVRKSNNQKRSADGEPSIVVLDLATFLTLIGDDQ